MHYITTQGTVYNYGSYTYEPLTRESAIEWITSNEGQINSFISEHNDADALGEMTGVYIPVNTNFPQMRLDVGDDALIVQAVNAGALKDEYGLLKRIE